MKNKILISAIIILLSSFSIFIFINVNITKNIKQNKKALDSINNILKEQELEIIDNTKENFPKLEIENTDYIGIINIPKNNLLLPIESKCNNRVINLQSSCKYSNNPFIILGTNLNDSFNKVSTYNIKDSIEFTNMLGQKVQYKINKIKRINNINDISKYDGDLIIAVKDYYNMEYILLICSYN